MAQESGQGARMPSMPGTGAREVPSLPPRPSAEAQSSTIDKNEATEKMFAQLLEIQGVPKGAQKELIGSMPLDKKMAMIQMHSQLLADGVASRTAKFTEDDYNLLRSLSFEIPNSSNGVGALQNALREDTKMSKGHLLEELRTRLSTANREWLSTFFRASGVLTVVNVARQRLLRDPFLGSDLWVLGSALDCFKRIANTADGLRVLMDTSGALEVLAASLEPSPHLLRSSTQVTTQAADILCVSVWASESALQLVLSALQRLAKRRLEPSFLFATKLMAKNDENLLPAKRSVATLLNQLLMKTNQTEPRISIRNAMRSVGLDLALEACVSYHLSENKDDMKYQQYIFEADTLGYGGDDHTNSIEKQANDNQEAPPRRGEMVGTLVATKQREAYVNTMAKALGGKATKHRVYTLRDGVLSWAKEKGEPDKHWIDMEEVLVVRPAARHPEINTPFALELVFAPPRTPVVLGVESQSDHDNWYLALRVSKRQAAERGFDLHARGGTASHQRPPRRSSLAHARRAAGSEKRAEVLHPEELREHALALKKQLDIFRAVAQADAALTTQKRFPLAKMDASDFKQIGQALLCAAAEADATQEVLRLLHELLCWPSHADAWKLAHEALHYVRSKHTHDDNNTTDPWKSATLELDKLVLRSRSAWGSKHESTTESKKEVVSSTKTESLDDPLSKYRKMLKMHIPRVAVELKMKAEGMNPADLDATTTTTEDTTSLPAPPPKFAKYFKMLKMHIPRAAVEAKMRAEGVDPAVLDSDVAPSDVSASDRASSLKINENPMHAKYFKMLKMHIPRPAVEAKMRAEGVDPALLDGGGDTPSSDRVSSVKISANPMHAKYFKMLQMHIPRAAVEAKMRAEGVNPALLDGASPDTQSAAPTAPVKKAVVKNNLKSLFWDKITDIEGTVWTELGTNEKRRNSIALTVDASKLGEGFNKKGSDLNQSGAKKGNAASATHEEDEPDTKVSLFDGKRIQNVLIGLSRVKLSHEAIRGALCDADTEILPALCTASGAELWLSLVPNDEELAAIQQYISEANHSMDNLGVVEHFFHTVGPVRQRLTALLELRRFDEAANDARSKLLLLSRGAAQIQQSLDAKGSALRAVLRATLEVGNLMNNGTARGEAVGFRPDILPKLATVKSSTDPSQTLMHFIVSIIENSETPLLAPALAVDLDALSLAATVDCSSELNKDVSALKAAVSLLKSEATAKDSPKFSKLVTDFLAAAEPLASSLRTDLNATKDTCLKLRASFFGLHTPIPHDEGCPIKTFFGLMSNFVAAFESARLDNVKARERAEAQERRNAELALRKARAKAHPPTPPPQLPPPPAEDLFDAFQAAQTASVDEIFAGFKQAHIAQLRSAIDDDDPRGSDYSDIDDDWND